ncbi:SGNH/GDSL hydrolase family protein [Mycobacterium sp. NPDC050441]|uniref:SGNH/GDSL hydrolase family protein n=1 Tax=Mycobacterium sp. NPDC050441 TaxID=3155403 RepID=UPI0033C60A74
MLFSIVLLVLTAGVGYAQWRRSNVSTHVQGLGASAPSIGSMFDYRPTLLIVGDSFAGGTGDVTFRPYPYLLGDRLGWNLTVDAQGGTGFINAGDVKKRGTPFAVRLDRDEHLYNADYVLIDGGRNDLDLVPVEVITAADEYIKRVRAAWRQAIIIVILPSFVSAEEASNYPTISAGMRRSAEEVAAHVIDPVAEGWYRERDLAPLFWHDGIHLNAVGNEYYASRIFDDMRLMGLVK